MTLNSVSPISKGGYNTHISSPYIIILTLYFENKIYKNVSPPNYLTPLFTLLLLFFLFYEATFWLLARAHRGI